MLKNRYEHNLACSKMYNCLIEILFWCDLQSSHAEMIIIHKILPRTCVRTTGRPKTHLPVSMLFLWLIHCNQNRQLYLYYHKLFHINLQTRNTERLLYKYKKVKQHLFKNRP